MNFGLLKMKKLDLSIRASEGANRRDDAQDCQGGRMMTMFMNPFTKLGEGSVFSQEEHKHILMDFMNAGFEGKFCFDSVNYREVESITRQLDLSAQKHAES